ncbi:hypothetical protein B7494_g3799 [Chlorociboria aeruginascens]|nr:hypothetical protein B7494_g3799 [Chlorociboria aeruginascens]
MANQLHRGHSPHPVTFLKPTNADKETTPERKTHFRRNFLDYLSLRRTRSQNSIAEIGLLDKEIENQEISPKALQIPLKNVLKMDSRVEATPYTWPHDNTFKPKTTALVIIDMQKDFCSPEGYLQFQGYDITPMRAIIPRIQSILSSFRERGFPIYHTREGHRPDLSTLSSRESVRSRNNAASFGIGDKGPLGRLLIRGEVGHGIIPELTPLPNEPIIDKPGRSAFQHTEFGLMLRIKGIQNLVFCGVTTDVCVHSTMREANDNGFDCVLVEDACTASEAGLHKSAVEMVKTEGGIFGAVTDTKKILEALKGVGRVAEGEGKGKNVAFDEKQGEDRLAYVIANTYS